ncbi:MAG: hypothetical protein LWX54_03080 [Deltaproteobacteria bacterium]|jgi:Na+/H+ antiporter NhaC|nr:hypothetical protein [Deltaproteobacteria bacterium]
MILFSPFKIIFYTCLIVAIVFAVMYFICKNKNSSFNNDTDNDEDMWARNDLRPDECSLTGPMADNPLMKNKCLGIDPRFPESDPHFPVPAIDTEMKHKRWENEIRQGKPVI